MAEQTKFRALGSNILKAHLFASERDFAERLFVVSDLKIISCDSTHFAILKLKLQCIYVKQKVN
jgi:hypothetical protein